MSNSPDELVRNFGLVRTSDGRVDWLPLDFPVAGTGCIIKMLYAGICGTDLQILDGQRSGEAKILGHEGVGEIIHSCLASEKLGFKRGDVVAFNPVDISDPNEVLGHSYDGVFQRFVHISLARIEGNTMVPIPNDLDFRLATLAEPTAVALYAVEIVRQYVANLDTVAIVGAGPAGIIHGLVAMALGAKTVFVISRTQERLNHAARLGLCDADRAFLDNDDLETEIKGAVPEGVDAVFFCANRANGAAGLRRAMSYVRPGGIIDMVSAVPYQHHFGTVSSEELLEVRSANVSGRHAFPRAIEQHFLDKEQIYITGHRGASPKHFGAAIDLLRSIPEKFSPLITDIFPERDAAAALRRMVNWQHEFVSRPLKALISY